MTLAPAVIGCTRPVAVTVRGGKRTSARRVRRDEACAAVNGGRHMTSSAELKFVVCSAVSKLPEVFRA